MGVVRRPRRPRHALVEAEQAVRPDRLQLLRAGLVLDDDRHAARRSRRPRGGSRGRRRRASAKGSSSGARPRARTRRAHPGCPRRVTASDRWPWSSNRCGTAVGMWPASHSPWPKGTIRSWRPCQTWTGAGSAESKPHGRMNAMSSSNQPQYDSRSASRNEAAVHSANSPVSAPRSTSSTRSPNASATSSA